MTAKGEHAMAEVSSAAAVPLRVLHVEDDPDAVALVAHHLRREGYELVHERVETAAAMQRALAENAWDVVLCDYDLPQFNAPAALRTLQASRLDLPFLIVSGAIGEETAVEMMRQGAHDYIPKGNLARLGPAIERELGDARARLERCQLEAERAALLDLADAIGGKLELSEILEQVQGRIAALIECPCVMTYRRDPECSAFHLVSAFGMPAELASATATVELAPEAAEAWQQNPALVVANDMTAQPWISQEFLARVDCSGFLAAPLVVHGELKGSLVAARFGQSRSFAPHEIRLFDRMSRQVALATGGAELFRAQREETLAAAAEARAAAELIGSLSTPRLFSRLCALTTELLPCERSATWLSTADGAGFNVVAEHGHRPGQWEALRLTTLPHAAVAGLLAHLEREGTAELSAEQSFGLPLGLVDDQPKRVLLTALRRGEAIAGVHVATRLGAQAWFSALDRRVAKSLAHVASLALENARLVEEIERANRIKSDFLATMSHELRTPLHIIMGYVGLLYDGEFGALAAEQVRIVEIVQRSAEGLLKLITATLDISRLERGQVSLDTREVRIRELLDEVADEMRGIEPKPGVELRWEAAPELPPIHTDAGKLKVVVKNLLANALKFTEAGHIAVRAEADRHGVAIAVADTGIGIAPALQSVVFEPFRQGESGATRRYGGVGLGLYVVRRLVDLLGGTIALDSEPGRGSTFRVSLPLTPPAGQSAR